MAIRQPICRLTSISNPANKPPSNLGKGSIKCLLRVTSFLAVTDRRRLIVKRLNELVA